MPFHRRRAAVRHPSRLVVGAVLVFALAVGVTTRPAHAQGVYGPTGLFVHATAGTQTPGSVIPSASYLVQKKDGVTTKWRPIGLTYGVDPHFQIGGEYLRVSPDGGQGGTSGGGFIKYRFKDDSPSWRNPAFAAVVNILAGDLETQQFTLVASHAAYRGLRDPSRRPFLLAHLGLEVTRWKGLGDNDFRNGTSVYVGAEYPFSDRLRAIAEVGTKLRFDESARAGIGLTYAAPSEGVNLSVGVVSSGQSKNLGFFAGIGFPFGGGKKAASTQEGGSGNGGGARPQPNAIGFPFGGGK